MFLMKWLIKSKIQIDFSLGREEKAYLVNADRFLVTSGQKSYFYEIKLQLTIEITRLTELNQKLYYKKKEWKRKYLDNLNESLKLRNKMEKDLEGYRQSVFY